MSTARPGGVHPAAHAAVDPHRRAVVLHGTADSVSYGELDSRSLRLAQALRAAGCGVGDTIAVLLGNHPRYAEVCWAANRSGLHYVPVNTRLSDAEASFIVEDSGAKVVVTCAALAAKAEAVRAASPGPRRWLMMDGASAGMASYEEELAAHPALRLADETEGAVMLYSSGTTGRPKGILRPLSGLPPGSTMLGHDSRVSSAYELDGDSVVLIPSPLYHSMGVHRLMMATGLGATVVLLARFDAAAALDAIEAHRVTHAAWVPTMFVRFLRLDPVERSRADLSSMVAASVGSAPCPAWVKAAMIEWWGPIITEVYGGSEGMGMTRISSEEWLARPGSVGRAVYGEPRIVRADGTEAATGEDGVVYFAGGRPFEYRGDPARTASVRTEAGWTTLGDIGHLDDDGYLYLTDRAVDLIIVGGANVYPREVEDLLLGHPAVDDVAVIGLPDDEYGEQVKAVVSLRVPGAACEALAAELIAHCRSNIAGYKCPRSVDFVDELPREETGKLTKRRLRARYLDGALPR